MPNRRFSLRNRIFISMIFLVVVASILIASITVYQYNEQAEDYHVNRLERKEEAIKSAISYELNRQKDLPIGTYYLPIILNNKLNEIADIHNLDINIYDLEGKLLRSSHARFGRDTIDNNLSVSLLNKIRDNSGHRLVLPKIAPDGKKFRSSYSYLVDKKFKPIGVIGIPYLQDNSFQDDELKEFLERLSLVYILILLIAIIIAYFLSKYITKSIESVSRRMQQTDLDKPNEKIKLEDASSEIFGLVNSYNKMVDQLEESAIKIAQVERKHAWKEMAKQVAHEIKNPLTPMRLTVQSFEHRFDPTSPDIKDKLKEFCQSLIQQIDTMSSIASAFSNFAQMPNPRKEYLNVVEEVKRALDIFQEPYIFYYPERKEIFASFDKVQLTRVVTNLITNAIRAVKSEENPKVEVRVLDSLNFVTIEIDDNGVGISEVDAAKVFEPKFTTKTSGMGLGLSMVKSMVEANNGEVYFESEVGKGSYFTVTLPKN